VSSARGQRRQDDRIKMRQGWKVVSALIYCIVICELSYERLQATKMESLSKIKQGCRTVFTKQLRLVNLAIMSIIMNYLPKGNGKGNCLNHVFVSPVKLLKCHLDLFGTTQSICLLFLPSTYELKSQRNCKNSQQHKLHYCNVKL